MLKFILNIANHFLLRQFINDPCSALSELFDYLEKLIKTIDNENKGMYILCDLDCDLLKPEKNLKCQQRK